MNDNVRIYHVDEYCEGASHFSFSERKDVVLLEDYEKLREENERLKGENAELIERAKWNAREQRTHNEKMRNKLAKLKCLALHLMTMYFFVLRDDPYHGTEYYNLCLKYSEAYRKAKKELMEGGKI